MIEVIALIVVTGICILEGIIIYRKVRQGDKYQEVIDMYENWIENFTLTVEVIDKELDKIDAEGTFRSDDEVGYFYQSMYSILKRLSEFGLTEEPVQVPSQVDEVTDMEFYVRNKQLTDRIKKRRQDISIEEIREQKQKVAHERKHEERKQEENVG